ncbi:alpha/beta hydrolase domain-containing protein 17b [Phtheirospermum japonicum]|uniref:Alpha/beta hydrolase domain-containing protein 17b n=1 Tax=Phtheirospermum japonicum TaxID=374723 RepID=A0A830C761_9LAMI|nr:alpha/beta hydrolase domain-containing protein 17b [Phtheirospermum japonicum]
MGCIISQVAAKFAFFPPTPPTYQVKKREDDVSKLVAVSTTSSLPIIGIDGSSSLDVLSIPTKRGNNIVAFYLRNPYARLTMLYSHGNAADLGQLVDLFLQLRDNLRVNLIGLTSNIDLDLVLPKKYDYSGYGASTGKPSEFDTYADIEAVYEYLQTEYGISQEDLILYGQSVGSGPTLHLAAKLPSNCIHSVQGTEDEVVNWLHGNGLWKLAREPYEPLWIKGGGHCNLELYPDYIAHLCTFVREMENMTTDTTHMRGVFKPLLLLLLVADMEAKMVNATIELLGVLQMWLREMLVFGKEGLV